MTSGFSFIMLGFLPLVLLLNSLIFCANSSYSLNKLYIFFSTIFNVIYNSTYRFTFCKIILFFLAVFLPLFRFFLRNLQFLDLALFLGIKSFNDNCSVLGFKTFKASICFFPQNAVVSVCFSVFLKISKFSFFQYSILMGRQYFFVCKIFIFITFI